MKGNRHAGAQGEHLRLLLTYKGSADAGEPIQDDYVLLTVKPDAAPEPVALAVITFPVLEGKRALFLHDIQPYKGHEEERKLLLDAAESFARKQGYQSLYINTARQKQGFLKRQGFQDIPDMSMAKKDLCHE